MSYILFLTNVKVRTDCYTDLLKHSNTDVSDHGGLR